jgi:endonuclease/exonuclease/phosphatase family metal-dependent hydrolase
MRPLLRLLALTLLAACASVPPHGPSIRVLVYNIHAGKDAAGIVSLDRIADVVRSTHADIVLLQEVDRNTARSGRIDHFATLEQLTKFDGVFGKALDFQGGEYGIAILSRWPVVAHRVAPYAIDPSAPRSFEPRIALVADIRTPSGSLRVINTHLDASREESYRDAEALQLVQTIAGEIPQLAGGDFNSTPNSLVHDRMQKSGLRDAWLDCGSGQELTYPADTPAKRIDYLYLAKSVSCSSASVIETQASDHRPVLFTIQFH